MRERFADRMTRAVQIGLCVTAWVGVPAAALAQGGATGAVTLNDAIQLALKNYPAINESRARAQAAEEGIGVARTAYLPRLDLLWQANQATHNNVFGLLFPQSVVPPISGPVLGTTSFDSVWGSAGGVLLSWEAVDFGVRKASVNVARAHTTLAKAQTELSELDGAAAAADAFLTVLASDEAVRAARANVERLRVFADSVGVLVKNQLRPGADQSRAEAELAIGRNQLTQALQTSELAVAALTAAIGAAGTAITLDGAAVANVPDPLPGETPPLASHPAARAGAAAIDAVRAREQVLERSYAPHVSLQSALAGRGSGAEVPGLPAPGHGLAFQVPNWAIGVSVTFPAFDLFTIRARQRVESQNEAAERARYEQTVQNLTTQQARAQALMKAATEIARNTPIARAAAIDAESRARARYASGLANITEVAEAQRLLAQVDADDALARLGMWRASLAMAQAGGDLRPFLDKIRR